MRHEIEQRLGRAPDHRDRVRPGLGRGAGLDHVLEDIAGGDDHVQKRPVFPGRVERVSRFGADPVTLLAPGNELTHGPGAELARFRGDLGGGRALELEQIDFAARRPLAASSAALHALFWIIPLTNQWSDPSSSPPPRRRSSTITLTAGNH